MILLLMRHGKAEQTHPQGDRFRSLSPLGRERNKAAAQFLKKKDLVPERVFVSPLTRSAESAQDLQKVLGFMDTCIETKDCITPFGDEEELLREIEMAHQQGVKCLLVLSHNPFVSGFSASLVSPSPGFQTSSIRGFEKKKEGWTAQFYQDFSL